jgi:hypothetical protein
VAATVVGYTKPRVAAAAEAQGLVHRKRMLPRASARRAKEQKGLCQDNMEQEIFRCLFLACSCASATPCPIRQGRLPRHNLVALSGAPRRSLSSAPSSVPPRALHVAPDAGSGTRFCCILGWSQIPSVEAYFVDFILASLCVTACGFPDKVIFPDREAKSTMVESQECYCA